MSLKQKFLSGVMWSSVSQGTIMALEFGFGILLANLLSPREFGLIGMITVFITIGTLFINSGFSQALIRKTDCSDEDYSTVFVFNLVVAALFYLFLFFCSPLVSWFYSEPLLTPLLRVLSLSLLISGVTIIQRTTIIRRLDFKLQARISILASLGSGILSISCAIMGMGVWSLIVKILSRELFYSILIWIWNSWKVSLTFSRSSFKELFGFGSNLLLSGIFGTLISNLNYIIIGKYYSAASLGFYTRAEMFKRLPSENLNAIVAGVSYPTLSKIKDDKQQLKQGFKKILTSTSFLIFLSMFGLFAISDNLIIGLIGEAWSRSIPMLKLLSFVGVFVPLNSINVNILNVIGRSDLYLKLQLINQILVIPAAIIGLYFGIISLILALLVNAFIGYFIYSYYSGVLIGYSTKEQIIDLLPGFLLASSMGLFVFFLGRVIPVQEIFGLVLQIIMGVATTVILSELFKNRDYLMLKGIIIEKIYKK